MPTNYKVLGQSAPAANTTVNVYTVPAATQAVISSIVICNRNNVANVNAVFRIAVQPAGAALANQHFICYDVPLGGLDSTSLSLGITLGANDVISCNTANANMSFSVFGSEIT